MKIITSSRSSLLTCLLVLGLGVGVTQAESDQSMEPTPSSQREIIPIQQTENIRAVYQISSAETKGEINAGLHYLRKLHQSYLDLGIDPAEIHLHGVFHGEASAVMLTDEAWNKINLSEGGNPNTAVIAELSEAGVSVELCNTRRVANGWSMEQIHSDVVLVSSAYQRLIDLQARGYAYIRL